MENEPHSLDTPRRRNRACEIEDVRLQAKARSQLLHLGCRSAGQYWLQAAADRFPRDQLARVAIGTIDHPRRRHGSLYLRHAGVDYGWSLVKQRRLLARDRQPCQSSDSPVPALLAEGPRGPELDVLILDVLPAAQSGHWALLLYLRKLARIAALQIGRAHV